MRTEEPRRLSYSNEPPRIILIRRSRHGRTFTWAAWRSWRESLIKPGTSSSWRSRPKAFPPWRGRPPKKGWKAIHPQETNRNESEEYSSGRRHNTGVLPAARTTAGPKRRPPSQEPEGNRGAAESASRAAGQGLGRRTDGHQ